MDDLKTPDDEFEKIDVELEPMERLSRDLRRAAATLSDTEARYLVDTYYSMQKNRIRAANQMRAMGETKEPHDVLTWFGAQSLHMEKQIKAALQNYVLGHKAGPWAIGQKGIGPVITAGILARIDIKRCPTAGHIWAFAGLDPTRKWESGKKRPWNAALKRICWLAGEGFVKVCNRDGAFYGQVFKDRKALEVQRNVAGMFADQAREALATKRIDKSTDAYGWYSGEKAIEAGAEPGTPMLPPARIHLRAQRYAVKLFLAHLHEVWRSAEGLDVPMPYPIAQLGHAHRIAPPDSIRKE